MLRYEKGKFLAGLIIICSMIWMLSGCGGSDAPPAAPTAASQTVENYVVSCILFDEDIVVDQDSFLVPGKVLARATDKNGNAVMLFADKTGGTRIDGIPQPTATGLMTFYVDSGVTALPITLTVAGIATNFIPNNKVVTIDSAGFYTVSVGLIDEITTPIDSVQTASAITTADANTGATPPATVTATIVPIDAMRSAAQASIPPSTVLTTASGTPLAGSVNISIASVAAGATANSDAVNQLSTFPGGMGTVILTAPPTGTTSTVGAMETTGFVRVHLVDASGNIAKTASNPLTIRIDILAGTINPATGAALQAGETMAIWTYDEVAQQWSPFKDASGNQLIATVKSDSQGLYVDFTTTHLSYFALALFNDKCSVAVSDKSLSLLDVKFRSSNYLDACVPTSTTRCTANIPINRTNIQMVVAVKKLGIPLYVSPKFANTNALCSSVIDLAPFISLVTATATVNVRNVCPTNNQYTGPIFSQEIKLFVNKGTTTAPVRGNYLFSIVTNNTTGSASFESTNDQYVAQVQKRGTTLVQEVPLTVNSANVTKNIDFPDTALCPPITGSGGF